MVDLSRLNKLKLTYDPNGDNYQYDILPINNVGDDLTKESVSITPPGTSYKENIQYGMNGQENKININFVIWDNGVDRSDGTASGITGFSDLDNDGTSDEVVTVTDQIKWLKNYVQAPPVTAIWTLTDSKGLYGDLTSPGNGLNVYFNRVLTNPYDKNNPVWKPATIELKVGGV